VLPILVQHQAQARLRAQDKSVRQTTQQLASRQAENKRLTDLAADSSLTQEQLNDLRKLQAEISPLRQQAKEVAHLQQENRQLRSKTGQDEPKTPVQIKEEATAKLTYGKNWMIAFYQFANKYQGRFPTDFGQAAEFAPDKLRNQSDVTTNQLEIVFQGSPSSLSRPQDTIVLREREAWDAGATSHAGKWAKIYVFADGHSEIHHEQENNFDDYEKTHMVLPPAGNP
jgi:hypothetical protein